MIRPFRPGDLYSIQRLNRQVANFHTVQTLLQPHSSAAWSGACSRLSPGRYAGCDLCPAPGWARIGSSRLPSGAQTPGSSRNGCPYPLHQPCGSAHRTPRHLAKTALSLYSMRRRHQGMERIYADVPDQPLPVNTFAGVGFQPYCRQTIWRLYTLNGLADEESHGHDTTNGPSTCDRQVWQTSGHLAELYRKTVPEPVQARRGGGGGGGRQRRGRQQRGRGAVPHRRRTWLHGNSVIQSGGA